MRAHLGAHGDVGSLLDLGLHILRQHLGQVGCGGIGAIPHDLHCARIGQVVHNNLTARSHACISRARHGHARIVRELGEVPPVPLAHTHGVNVEFLVEIIQQRCVCAIQWIALGGQDMHLQIACTIIVSTLSGENLSL